MADQPLSPVGGKAPLPVSSPKDSAKPIPPASPTGEQAPLGIGPSAVVTLSDTALQAAGDDHKAIAGGQKALKDAASLIEDIAKAVRKLHKAVFRFMHRLEKLQKHAQKAAGGDHKAIAGGEQALEDAASRIKDLAKGARKPIVLEPEVQRSDVLKLLGKSVVRIRVLIYVVSSQQRVFNTESLGEVVTEGKKPESTAAEVTKLPIVTASGIDAQVVDPIRAPARRAYAGYVLVGKPHVVGEITAIDGQELF